MDYELLAKQMRALTEHADGENTVLPECVSEPVTVLANAAALLYEALDDINWAGFYMVRERGLLLGPFQGKPACVWIDYGKGVCGRALATGRTQVVPDVHKFPGHIACDSASASEIVIPVRDDKTGEIAAVMDIDSPSKNRFSEGDAEGLTLFVHALEEVIDWNPSMN